MNEPKRIAARNVDPELWELFVQACNHRGFKIGAALNKAIEMFIDSHYAPLGTYCGGKYGQKD